MAIPIVNSRDLKNTWRILDDKLGNYRDRGLPFKYPYVGAFSQSVSEYFIKVYSNPGDTVFEPFCVAKNSVVLLGQQDRVRIQDISRRKDGQQDLFGKYRYKDRVISLDINYREKSEREGLIRTSNIDNIFIKESGDVEVCEILTRNKRMLVASESHMFLVRNRDKVEWKRLKEIKSGDMVAVFPSIIHLDNSVEKEEIILTEEDILNNIHNNPNVDKIIFELNNAGLLPLTNKNPKLPIIARLCGFLMTDGHISECDRDFGEYTYTDHHLCFTSGRISTLLDIDNDLKMVGFSKDNYISDLTYGKDSQLTASLFSDRTTIGVFFKSLEIPMGRKTMISFDVPEWLYRCSKRVRQEFLGGLFGGDGTVFRYDEQTHISGYKNIRFSSGAFSQSKRIEMLPHLLNYLNHVDELLKEFGIESSGIEKSRKEYKGRDQVTKVSYRINLSNTHRNILNFLRYVGYRYDDLKLEKSYSIYEYLITKDNRVGIDKNISKNVFPSYKSWMDRYVLDNIIFDEVVMSKKIKYDDDLLDLSISGTCNYIVNGFVTHNSGRGTTAMQALWTDRNVICNDLSPYSNVLCHSIMYVPYMRDVLIFMNILEGYINSNRCNISTDYAGKGSDNDTAKLYHEKTFDKIIKLRNILNSRDVLLGLREDLFGEIGNEYKDDQKMVRAYRHEVVMFTRLVMSQLMLHSSQDMSFNGIKTRGTDNTYIKGILKYYDSLGESPKDVNIFENMRHYVDHMGLDELGVKNKFGRLSRKLISCDARKLDLPDKCADIVVTSPPYYANLNYGMANWLRIWTIGGIGDPLIGGHINSEVLETKDNSEIYGKTYDRITDKAGGTVDNPMSYSGFTGQYLHELYRVLKDDAVAIIVVGDYGNKKKVEAWRLVTDRAEIFGFKPVMVIMDELNKQTKSSTQFQMKHDGGKNDYDVCVVLYKGNYKQKNDPENIDFRWGAKFVDGSQLDIDSAWGNI